MDPNIDTMSVRRTVTFERLGLKVLAKSERSGTEKLYEAIEQPDGRYHVIRWEDERQELAFVRDDRDDAVRSLNELVDTLAEFAGSRI